MGCGKKYLPVREAGDNKMCKEGAGDSGTLGKETRRELRAHVKQHSSAGRDLGDAVPRPAPVWAGTRLCSRLSPGTFEVPWLKYTAAADVPCRTSVSSFFPFFKNSVSKPALFSHQTKLHTPSVWEGVCCRDAQKCSKTP